MVDWHEDDSFWRDMAPMMFTEERMRSAASEVKQAITLLELGEGSTVLDLGCGPGRHSIEFARQGFSVTGVDRTAEYLKQAAERATRESLQVEWQRDDMRSFRRPDSFDAAFSLLTSFGYFAAESDDRTVLENIFASLKPGGRLLMDLMGKEVLARIYRPRDWHDLPGGSLLLEDRKVDAGWSRLDVRWILVKGGDRREHRFFLRLYSAAELSALLRAAAFESIKTCGSFAGAAYDENAERLIIVAQKPVAS